MRVSIVTLVLVLLAGVLLPVTVHAQHRGDNLAFQGLDLTDGFGVKAIAMGGAFTGIRGELDALYWNPAGLIGISGLQLSINGSQSANIWRERQDYRPNRQLVTLSFILDGLYTFKPEYSGWYDYEVFLDDSAYFVEDPMLGEDPYSKESADWQKKDSAFRLYHITAAMPFKLMGKSFVVSAGYYGQLPVLNYDRNQTHLTPHIGFDGYGDIPPRVTSAEDSIRMIWSDYTRERMGTLTSITGGLAFGLNKNISFGASVHYQTGKIDESLTLSRIGYFDMVQDYQVYRFAYDTLDVGIEGSSSFNSMRFDLGAAVDLNRFTLGIRFSLPYTITRKWDHTRMTSDPSGSVHAEDSGEDEVLMPWSIDGGFSVAPVSMFRIAFNISHTPYSQADFTFAAGDTTHRGWMDRTSFGVGLEFKPLQIVSLLAGYRNTPQVWQPDGNGSERGPEAETYSFGISVKALLGRFDITYLIRSLKYYDAYYSNTNWAYERTSTLLFGYTLMLQ